MSAHEHTFTCQSVRAPIGPAPAHTVFAVLTCECGAVDVFPAANFELTTPEYRAGFVLALRTSGQYFEPIAEAYRTEIANGATHDCGEWRNRLARCALCGRSDV